MIFKNKYVKLQQELQLNVGEFQFYWTKFNVWGVYVKPYIVVDMFY